MIHSLRVERTVRRRKERKKEKKKKKEEKSDPGPHGFTRPMDITRGLEQQEVPVAVHSLSPTAIDEISKIRILWSIFWLYGTNDEAPRSRATSEIFTKLAAFGDAFPCAMQSWTRAQKGSERAKRNEAERRQDPTGWCCGPPNALRACGFRYLGSSGEDKKASLERTQPTLRENAR